jgi:hypothetical protein
MKEFLITINLVIGISELALAAYFWKTHSGSAIRKVMTLLAFSTGMWVILTGLFSYGVIFISYTDIATSFVYTFGVILVTALLHLVILFPHSIFNFDRLHAILLYVPAFIFSLASFTKAITKYNALSSIDGYVISYPGPLHVIYNTYLFLLYTLTVLLLVNKIRRFDGVSRRNALIVLIGIVIGGIPIVIIDLILTTIGVYPNPSIATALTAVWLGTTAYIVFKKT